MTRDYSDVALLWITLRHGAERTPWWPARFYFLCQGTDGPADALSAMKCEGISGVRLNTRHLAPGHVRNMGRDRLVTGKDCLVVDAVPAFIHASAVGWAEAVPDEIAFVPHDQLETLIGAQATGLLFPIEDILGYLKARAEGDL